MKELKKRNIHIIFFVSVAMILFSCKPLLTVRKKHHFKKGNEYYNICNEKFAEQDTLKLDRDMVCIFDGPVLKQVGKLDGSKKVGVWYLYSIYSKNGELDLIIRYKPNKPNKDDNTWIWSRGTINQAW